MRLIDADKLAGDIYRAWTLWEKKGEDCYLFAEVITPMLIGQPTIEAEPVRHGHWVKNDEYSDEIEGHTVYECSECGELYDWFDAPEHKYCRNCGAKMDEVSDDR